MGVIDSTEDAIIDQVEATLSGKVRSVESLSGPWTLDSLKRALQFAPCVRVAFLGGQGSEDEDAAIHASFGIYFIAGQTDDALRRRGTAREIGIYEMLGLAVPALNEFTISNVGTLKLKSVQTLFTEQTFQLGGSVFAAMFTLPNMVLPSVDDSASMNDFITFHADSQLDADADIELETEETLPV